MQRRAVGRGLHDVGHVIPPFAHNGELRKLLHGVARAALEHGEEMVGAFVEENPVVADAGFAQRVGKRGPDLAMTSLVFVALTGVEHHPEGDSLHALFLLTCGFWRARRRVLSDYNSCTDSQPIRCWDRPIHKPNRTWP